MGIILTDMKCKNCGGTLDPANIVVRLAMARCGHCNSVFAIESTHAPTVRFERAKVPLPERIISNKKTDGSLELVRSWKSPVAYFLGFFAIFWNGFMIVWFTLAISSGAWSMAAFGLLHAGVGIYLIYFAVASFLNSTVITVGQGVLTVNHRPLKWPGGDSYVAAQIRQFYCKEKVSRNKNGTTTTYTLRAITTDSTHHVILKLARCAECARFRYLRM